MDIKCTDDHRVFNQKGEQVEVYWEEDTYSVSDEEGEKLLATGKFEKVGE